MTIYWINDFEKGAIGMMPKPKGGVKLLDEIRTLKKRKIDCIVCLIEYSEIIELDLEQEEYFCKKEQIDFIHFPIKDYKLPNKANYLNLINKINLKLKNNENIAIHCRMGIGRTSTIAAGVLLKNKIHTENIFEYLSKIRTVEVPDTLEQKEWVLNLKNELIA